MRRIKFRPTHRATLEANNAADRFYAAMAGVEPRAQSVIPEKRERAAPRKLEQPVVQAIAELLAVHPKVLIALRINSGSASYEAKSGKWAPVAFHRWIKPASGMRMSDFLCVLKDGRVLAIEAKAPTWKKPTDTREREQEVFLTYIRSVGGIGIFATSAQDVANALS